MNASDGSAEQKELVNLLRQLVSAQQQIAKTLMELQRAYVDELGRREVRWKQNHAETIATREWMRRQEQQNRDWHDEAKEEQDKVKLPRLPWQLKLFWGLLFLLICLLVLVVVAQLIAMIGGTGT
jgi:hypothetical protein